MCETLGTVYAASQFDGSVIKSKGPTWFYCFAKRYPRVNIEMRYISSRDPANVPIPRAVNVTASQRQTDMFTAKNI